jgi:hypothetical protein
LKNFVKYDPSLIHRTPQPELPAFDLHNNFIEMPDVARLKLPATQARCN